VGDFEVPSNWAQGSVPGAADLAAFNNRVNANWTVMFNSAPTNFQLSIVAPTEAYETRFSLNQQVWTATGHMTIWEGSGGRIVFTNGQIRVPSLLCETQPPAGSTRTNHSVIAFQNVRSESANANFAGSITSFEGGEHTVSNLMKVGTVSGQRAYATVFLQNGTRFSVTNELRIGDASGSTGRVDVAESVLRMGNNSNSFGFSVQSKGTLTIGAGADVYASGVLYAGLSGHGVVEQSGGTCVISNAVEVGVNAGSRGEFTVQGGQFTIRDQRPVANNHFRVATNPGATGEVTLAGGTFTYLGETCAMGRSGYGRMTVTGGTNVFNGNVLIGTLAGGVGDMTVLGGSNTFSSVAAIARLQVGGVGRGTLLSLGGTNSTVAISVANDSGSSGVMTVSNGLWTVAEHMWVGNAGNGALTICGGEMRFLSGGPVLSIGRYGVATGEVTVAGGLVDMGSNGSVWVGRADQTKNAGRLVLAGTGVLRTKQIFEHIPGPTSASQILFDGGTLKASASGTLVYSIDDVRLTTNGMVIDSAGFNVSVATVLQDAAGQAGGITKKGAGTLTLAADRNATGPVSVLGGTLVVSNAVAVSADTSRIDGALTLTAANRLTVAAGAALAGTGTVARVTLQDSAVFTRAKADGAVTPLTVSDCVADNRLTLALTGYVLTDLITSVPLMRTPTVFMDVSKITVTLNGQSNSQLTAKFVEVGGQQVLYASYSTGTLMRVW